MKMKTKQTQPTNQPKFTIKTFGMEAFSGDAKAAIEQALYMANRYKAVINLKLNGVELDFSFKYKIEEILDTYNRRKAKKDWEEGTPPDSLDGIKELEGKEGDYPCWNCLNQFDVNAKATLHYLHKTEIGFYFYCTKCKQYFVNHGDGRLKNLGVIKQYSENGE